MRACGVSMSVGSGSRLPALIAALEETNRLEDEKVLREIVERAADPRDFVTEPDKHAAVVAYLNQFLRYDDLELQSQGGRMRLVASGTTFVVTESLSAAARTLELDSVNRDLERALANAEVDPEDAVTSACAVLESVLRSILVEIGKDLPDKKDIASLYKAAREPLGLAPEKTNAHDLVVDDVRSVLSGLITTVQSIGALRTHGGDAHGREAGKPRSIDGRIARLAIHSSGAAALFMIETWQRRYPAKVLHQH
ncbi:hypothetical protein EON79_13140 [bacterium]|nr:MAG: hypothetical protein EON79_13140 [bacterium]